MSTRCDFAVVGGGLVGATVAYALALEGRRVALIETSPPADQVLDDLEYDLRVSAISPESRDLLSELGLWNRVDESRVCAYEQIHIWHQHGDASLSFDAVDLARDDLGVIVENRVLQDALHRACTETQGLIWYRPDRVEQLLENSSTPVVLRLDSGRIVEADWVIAADGRRSSMREMAGLSAHFHDYNQTAFVANVTTSRPHDKVAAQRFLATGPLAFLPLANGQSSIVWSCDNDLAQQIGAMDDDGFCAQLGEAFEYRMGDVVATSPRACFPLSWHHCERWFDQRVLLIGDAAHSVHPLAGQGVNLGFSDIACLLDMISLGDGVLRPRLLRRYERRRKSETWLASQSLSGLKWCFGLQQIPLTQVRNLGLRMVRQTPWLKRELMRRAVHNLA